MSNRPYNFGAGPAMLPEPVLHQIQTEMLDWRGMGRSILEIGHRSAEFKAVLEELEERLRWLMGIGPSYAVLFCQGGGRLQFSMVPLNLLGAGVSATYVITGTWSRSAATEASRYARINTVWNGSSASLPTAEQIDFARDDSYLYYCDNETVQGIEFPEFPGVKTGPVPIVCDMSSNFMSRPVNVERYGLVWAAAQKNFGTAGLTVAILRRDLLDLAGPETPLLLNYSVYAKTQSLPGTPAVFQIYVANLMARWIDSHGGLSEMDELARERSGILYRTLDETRDVYVTKVAPAARSRMNVVFRLRNEALTDLFVREAEENGLLGIAGHRSVGGIRVSLYNAMPVEGAQAMADFMKDFARRYPAKKAAAARA